MPHGITQSDMDKDPALSLPIMLVIDHMIRVKKTLLTPGARDLMEESPVADKGILRYKKPLKRICR